jgi:hypothetical protein
LIPIASGGIEGWSAPLGYLAGKVNKFELWLKERHGFTKGDGLGRWDKIGETSQIGYG